MPNTWFWLASGGGAFDSAANWGKVVNGTLESNVGLPGAGDVALNVTGAVSGNGSVGLLDVMAASFTGTLTTGAFEDVLGNVSAQGATITANDVFSIAPGASLSATGGAVLNGPSVQAPNGPFGNAGFQDYGSTSLDGGSNINAYAVNDAGALVVTSGTVTATDFNAGYISGNTSLSVAASGSIGDTLGVIGIAAGATVTASLDGGKWSNGELIVGGSGNVTFTVSNGASLTADGSYAVFPGAPALFVGSRASADVTTMTITGSTVTVTGDAAIGPLSTATVTFGANGTMSVSGTLTAGASAGGVGGVDVTGATALLTVGGDATIAGVGHAELGIGSGDSVTVGANLVAGGATGGAGTLSVGGVLDVTGNATIGAAGTATVTVAASSSFSVGGALDLGAQSGGNGTVLLDAGGLAEIVGGGNVTVGDLGTGSLDVNAGTLTVPTGNIVIGNAAASTGDMSVEKSLVTTTGNVTVGQSGTATLSVNQGGGISGITLSIGSGLNGNGNFVLDGTGSTADVNMLTDGALGAGALQITDKALLTATGNATLASQGIAVQQTASIGTKGSLIVAGVLDVAKAGNALLTVDTEGHVQAPTVLVGDTAGATGTIVLSGASSGVASLLQYGTLLAVGKSGTGALSITQGALVEASATHTGTVEIGVSAGASGAVTVGGGNAELAAALLTVGGGKSAAGGAGTLTIASGGTVAADSVTVWAGGVVTMAGGRLDPDPIANQGGISGFGVLAGAVNNTGLIAAIGGTLALTGSVDGGGTLTVASGAVLDLQQAVTASATIDISGGTLQLDNLATMAGTITNFARGDTIRVLGLAADGGTYSAGVLTLTDAGAAVGVLGIAGGFTSSDFKVSNSAGTTDVSIACFAAGTRISVADGEVKVEALRQGDCVRTQGGRLAPVRWVGWRHIACDRHPRPDTVYPVRVAAHAFAPGQPRRDLLLSPDHAVFIGGVLIPVRLLVNGTTVAPVAVADITYFHVELDRHDVLLAEGLPAESYLDTGNRSAFVNGGTVVRAHPDFARVVWDGDSCAELVVAGPALTAVRARLSRRSGHAAPGPAIAGRRPVERAKALR